MITATRYHDFSAGHVVMGHEGKCAQLHGHNYRVHFTVESVGALDSVGRVVDFSVIKHLGDWLEENWDHKFLIRHDHPLRKPLVQLDSASMVVCSFNPTAENMGQYLLHEVGPYTLLNSGARLIRVVVEETRKCSAEVTL